MTHTDPETYAIIGAAMRVHNELGPGFFEAVYQEALPIDFKTVAIPFEREVLLKIQYQGQTLRCTYKADFICYGSVIVEIKALTRLETIHHAQVLNYLKATGLPKGLLINFGAANLEYKRFVGSQYNG